MIMMMMISVDQRKFENFLLYYVGKWASWHFFAHQHGPGVTS